MTTIPRKPCPEMKNASSSPSIEYEVILQYFDDHRPPALILLLSFRMLSALKTSAFTWVAEEVDDYKS